jgi:hypothetical protein
MEKRIVEHNLNFYIIEQDLYEPNEIFHERTKYILNNINKDTYDNLIKKSRLLSNIKIFGCEYSQQINNFLNSQ